MQLDWHSPALPDIYKQLASSAEGLSSQEAEIRLKKHGLNELPPGKADPAWKLLISQFNSPLMYIMMGATAVSYLLEHYSDTIFILVVLSSNALVGFWQEHKANRSLRALKNFIKPRARVVRDGAEREVDATHIVPGDIIALRAGERVPADARLIACAGLRTNEASLTGESKAISKTVEPASAEAELGDRTDMVFMGTSIEEGSGRAVVVATGIRTEYGDIVELLKETKEEPTPLQKTVASLSKIIGIFISAIVGAIVLQGYLAGRPFAEIFAAALALFVSAIPEGLLPAITIVLALGMRRILKQKGLVRRLAATETLGGVTVICTDKTGTLTQGKMEVDRILTADGDSSATDLYEAQKNSLPPAVALLSRMSLYANDGYIENPEAETGKLVVRGNLTEQALLKFCHRLGMNKANLDSAEPVLDSLLFSSDRKYSASLRESPSKETDMLYVVGAPERIFERARSVFTKEGEVGMDDPSYADLLSRMEAGVKEGSRMVACAYRAVPREQAYDSLDDLSRDLILVGIIALSDPVRPDAADAFKQTTQAGIRTIVVTGDNKWTATEIARQIGLIIAPEQTLEGHEIEAMSDADLEKRVGTILLYARVSPRHKLRIVRALQKKGEVVAMFGDGVNDAPALKAADIGVAVGTEVDATREVADLVLIDSGLFTVVKAVEQGRIIFDNIRRVFLYLITQDFSQFFLFMGSLALGLPLPLLPAQLLMVNLVESGLPDLALTAEQEKHGVMQEPPRSPKESVLNAQGRRFMFSVFAVSGGIAMCFYWFVLHMTDDINLARTMVMTLMCFESLFLAFSVRSFRRSMFRRDIFSNYWLTGAVGISLCMVLGAIYFEPLQQMLLTVPLTPAQWMIVLATNIVEIVLIDALKRLAFRKPALVVKAAV